MFTIRFLAERISYNYRRDSSLLRCLRLCRLSKERQLRTFLRLHHILILKKIVRKSILNIKFLKIFTCYLLIIFLINLSTIINNFDKIARNKFLVKYIKGGIMSIETDIRILVVDDDKDILEILRVFLEEKEYIVDTADGFQTAISLLNKNSYEIMILDKNMPGKEYPKEGGLELLKYIKMNTLQTDVIMITGYASVESAIEAMKLGAFDYIHKPFSKDKLLNKIDRILEYKSFIDPEGTIFTYKTLHNEILRLAETSEEMDNEDGEATLKSIETKIDYFFHMQKEWERIILVQRESLSNIASLSEQALDIVNENPELKKLLEKIISEANNRV